MSINDEWIEKQGLSIDRKEKQLSTDSTIIWLNNSTENFERKYESMVFPNAKLFNNIDECLEYITNLQNDIRIYLIVNFLSSANCEKFEHLLSTLQSLKNVHRIYFQYNSNEIRRMPESLKTKNIMSPIQLKRELISSEEYASLAFNVINKENICLSLNEQKRNEQEAGFMYTCLFKRLVLDINVTVNEEIKREEMLSYCRKYFARINNQSALTFLARYEQNEDHHSALWWYTCDGFLYKMLNEACRVQDIKTMYAMRVFIRHLHREIDQLSSLESHQQQSIFTLYRGQQLTTSAFNEIRSKIGGLLSINSFFSTSLDKQIALLFAGISDGINTVSVIFEINIPRTNAKIGSFADIDSVSAFAGAEKEYLFSFGSVFRIENVKEYPEFGNGIWFIQITLTTDSDLELSTLTDYMWNYNLQGRIDLSSFARLMYDMGKNDSAEEIYSIILTQVSSRDDFGFVLHQLGCIEKMKGHLEDALKFYQQSLRYLPQSGRERSFSTVATLYEIATAYCDQCNWDSSLQYIQRALTEIANRDETIKAQSEIEQESSCLHMLGTIYLEQHRLDDAIKYFEQALEIRHQILPSLHPALAVSYNDLGILYHRQKRYEQALSAYEHCLEIRRRVLPETHYALAIIYNNMANTLYWLERDQEALGMSQRAVDISIKSLGADHPMTMTFRDTFEGISASNNEH
ncbi:unnamed protein product [Adineta ricciae]|uniref:NAD(P)(+)--arginine ADP-ribosyltransferase n=1 Tax=Adineta ricciae TaxID=249248 RepID=A0A815Q408_ADIRI|nr:unnamed protein product [Adineta ricciae]CAF1458503.1 unnamed protein product [Adineta ricciae]